MATSINKFPVEDKPALDWLVGAGGIYNLDGVNPLPKETEE